jgi:ribosomal protein S21
MVEIKRKKGETFEAFLRRFNKKLMQSGKILQYKKIRFLKGKPSRNMQKKSALRKIKIRDKREYLKKIGRLPEDDFRKKRRR